MAIAYDKVCENADWLQKGHLSKTLGGDRLCSFFARLEKVIQKCKDLVRVGLYQLRMPNS